MIIKHAKIMSLYNLVLLSILLLGSACVKTEPTRHLSEILAEDTESAQAWIFWYWMHGAVSKEAITADMEAMKEVGIGGAMLMPIKDVQDSSFYYPSYETMTPEWWDLVQFAMEEAQRLNLKIGMNACDGFTCAGGPWITPEMSMQKVVWADTVVQGCSRFIGHLPQPEMLRNYYEDIATFAYPAYEAAGLSSYDKSPKVSTSLVGEDLSYLVQKGNTRQFSTRTPCWIQYAFDEPFTARSVTLKTGWNNYQANRLIIETSNDGIQFTKHTRLKPPRSGWLDLDADNTQAILPVTARYFRFVFDPKGSEPGAEDIDDAKWGPRLRTYGIELSGDPKINQFEGKTGGIWRIANETSEDEIPEALCVSKDELIDISQYVKKDGTLSWDIPEGKWVILRIGHTTTGHENYVGGGGKGLECDKFDPDVIRFQFDQWFGETFRQVGSELAGDVLKRFHIDSWECGSQNWSKVFPEEFKKRRGYDLLPYLPVMAGVPLQSLDESEGVLEDIRETVSELFTEVFYTTLHEEANNKNTLFSAECVAPVGVTDGMVHYKNVDIPMGEFWFQSPSHDKPNDMLDAISGAHIYGKKIIQAEALTDIRLDWDEHPGNLKPVVDRNYALGANRMVPHVMTLNPWLDRKPGMTLGVVGTFFQRNQTWWKPGKAFFDYMTNCQKLLQLGDPVVDIAVFTGEEIPRRAILPDRLVNVLPGIMGEERLESEGERLKNKGVPTRDLPAGVRTQKNMADPENWIDPLNGYTYDSFNKDALLNLAEVKNGRIVLPGGASYKLLVIPGKRKMAPNGGEEMSVAVAQKLLDLVNDGAMIMFTEKPVRTIGLKKDSMDLVRLKEISEKLFTSETNKIGNERDGYQQMWQVGKGKVILGPWIVADFKDIALEKDLLVRESNVDAKGTVAWTHRIMGDMDIYFISNQLDQKRDLDFSFRTFGGLVQCYDPVLDSIFVLKQTKAEMKRTEINLRLAPFQSCFVLFEKASSGKESIGINLIKTRPVMVLNTPWQVQFDPDFGGPDEPVTFDKLSDWSKHRNKQVKYYSGTAIYTQSFNWVDTLLKGAPVWLNLGDIANTAEVKINGKSCGICWTPPYRIRIDACLQEGVNQLEIAVTNTWANRLIRDQVLPEDKRITWTTASSDRVEGKPLLEAGLLGPVTINCEFQITN